ncbi:hypothetical protein [Streptomyces nigrescens]
MIAALARARQVRELADLVGQSGLSRTSTSTRRFCGTS